MVALQNFLQRIADHPVLSFSRHFYTFLTAKQWVTVSLYKILLRIANLCDNGCIGLKLIQAGFTVHPQIKLGPGPYLREHYSTVLKIIGFLQ